MWKKNCMEYLWFTNDFDFFLERHLVCPKVIFFSNICCTLVEHDINAHHLKICLMVVGLTFVVYQMKSSVYQSR